MPWALDQRHHMPKSLARGASQNAMPSNRGAAPQGSLQEKLPSPTVKAKNGHLREKARAPSLTFPTVEVYTTLRPPNQREKRLGRGGAKFCNTSLQARLRTFAGARQSYSLAPGNDASCRQELRRVGKLSKQPSARHVLRYLSDLALASRAGERRAQCGASA
jgi:hypothetical protein